MTRSSVAAAAALFVAALLPSPALAGGDRPVPPSKQSFAEDDRARFREIYCAVERDHGARFPYDRPCAEALHKLAGEAPPTGAPVRLGPPRAKLRLVVVPGILGECVEGIARPFEDAAAPLAKEGWKVEVLHVSGRSGSASNALQIRDQLKALRLEPGEKLALIGYSKGMSDILELLGSAAQSVVPSGSSIVSVTGVVRGTPIADRASPAYRAFGWIPAPHCPPGDRKGVESLTRAHRLAWLDSHELPKRLHYYSLPAFTDRSDVSLALKSGWSTLAKKPPQRRPGHRRRRNHPGKRPPRLCQFGPLGARASVRAQGPAEEPPVRDEERLSAGGPPREHRPIPRRTLFAPTVRRGLHGPPGDEAPQALDEDEGRAPDLGELDVAAPHQLVEARAAEPGQPDGLGDPDADRLDRRRLPGVHDGSLRRRAAKARSASRKPDSIAGTSSSTGSASP